MNISELYATTLAAANAAADLIMVSPDSYTGFADMDTSVRTTKGFLFQIVGDETVNLSSDITDHYVENNSSLQDHISLRPITITVSGFVGELTNVVPDSLLIAKNVVDRLGTLQAYVPSLTNTARRAFNLAQQVYSLSEKVIKAGAIAFGVEVQTAQEKAFAELYRYHTNRTLFYVATPFGQFESMAIQNIIANQSPDSKSISDFTITFKQVKFAQTKTISKQSSSRVGFSQPVNMGNI